MKSDKKYFGVQSFIVANLRMRSENCPSNRLDRFIPCPFLQRAYKKSHVSILGIHSNRMLILLMKHIDILNLGKNIASLFNRGKSV